MTKSDERYKGMSRSDLIDVIDHKIDVLDVVRAQRDRSEEKVEKLELELSNVRRKYDATKSAITNLYRLYVEC